MKRIKLLTPILGLTTLGCSIVPLATSCTTSGNEHISLSKQCTKKQTIDSNNMVYYHINLKESSLTEQDISVNMICAEANKFSINNKTINDNVLTIGIKAIAEFDEDKNIDFNLEVKTSSWSETLMGLTIEVKEVENIVELVLEPTQRCWFESEVFALKPSTKYTFVVDYKNYAQECFTLLLNSALGFEINNVLSTDPNDLTVTLDGELVTDAKVSSSFKNCGVDAASVMSKTGKLIFKVKTTSSFEEFLAQAAWQGS